MEVSFSLLSNSNCICIVNKGGDECAVQITNKNIITYSDKDFEEEDKEIKVVDLQAVYINSNRNQVVFKLKDSAEFFKTDSAASVIRTLVGVTKHNPIAVFDIAHKDISDYANSDSLPKSKYAVDTSKALSEGTTDSSKEGHQPKKFRKTGKPPGGLADKKTSDEEEDKDDSSVSDPEFDDENSNLTRDKSKCMITKETLDNFTLLKVIGEGAFGRVFMAKKDTGEVYAMKRIRKDKVLRSDAVESILLERKILSGINHPLLLGLKHVFTTEYRFYFF